MSLPLQRIYDDMMTNLASHLCTHTFPVVFEHFVSGGCLRKVPPRRLDERAAMEQGRVNFYSFFVFNHLFFISQL
jgi:hypothetical protein